MKAIRACMFAVLVLLTPAAAFAETEVGTITLIDGMVYIDAFGTGDFIEAIPGEPLYENSVVKTGYDGTGIVEVNGKSTELVPESSLRIASLLESREREKRFRWVSSIVNAAKSVFKAVKGGSEDQLLGGRAAEVNEGSVGWVTEDDDQEVFGEAMRHVEAGEFGEAVTLLREITDPFPGTFLPGEVAYWIGYCQYQLENYDEALGAFSAAFSEIGSESADPWSLPYYKEALFQSGTASYLTGNFDDAVGTMKLLLSSDEYSPFAFLVIADSLKETGDLRGARDYLDQARALFAGTEYASGIDELAKSFN